MTAIYSGDLKRHLVANRVRLSEADVKAWLRGTREVEFTPRHVPGRSA